MVVADVNLANAAEQALAIFTRRQGIGMGPQIGGGGNATSDRSITLLPVRKSDLSNDGRYYQEASALPYWLPTFPIRTRWAWCSRTSTSAFS